MMRRHWKVEWTVYCALVFASIYANQLAYGIEINLPKPEHGLHYATPAIVWDEALPLGNGILGALVWGDGQPLKISLDRTDLWDLRKIPEYHSSEYTYKKMRQWHEEGRHKDLVRLYEDPYSRAESPTKIPAGRIEITFGDKPSFANASLDIRKAIATTNLDDNRQVQVMVHAVEPVGIIRVRASDDPAIQLVAPPFGGKKKHRDAQAGQKQKINRGSLAKLGYPAPVETSGDGWQAFTQIGSEGFHFAVYLAWQRTGDEYQAVWSVASSFEGDDPLALAQQRVEAALQKGFDGMLPTHRDWWHNYWQQSSVELPNKTIERLWYLEQYKFGAASRRGAPPITLQGPWTADDGEIPPWKGDYHHDLNTEFCYLCCYSANHLEEGLSFLDWLWKTRDNCIEWTRRFFEMPGMNVPMTGDLNNNQMGGWRQYTHSATTAAWLSHHFYLHWRYSMDRDFLRDRAYPYLKDASVFIEAITAEKDADGKRTLPLTSSAEINDNRPDAWFKTITNYDLSLIRFLLGATAELADELDKSAEAKHWRQVLSEMPDFAYADDGRLLVAKDYPLQESHRHFSHIMAIHPLSLINFDDGESARRTIRAVLAELDRLGPKYWCGYSYSWLASIAARARDGVRAEKSLEIFAKAFTLRNSFHCNGDQTGQGYSTFTYRPFTLEGNFAAALGVQEMLLQSRGGTIRIFPAIPDDWKDVSFTTLRAEGAFLISAQRVGGVTQRVEIVSEKGGPCRLVSPFDGKTIALNLKSGERRTLTAPSGTGSSVVPGTWPEPRQNKCLTAIQPLPGAMTESPRTLSKFDWGRSSPKAVTVTQASDSANARVCIVAGALHCYDEQSNLKWQSHPVGLNYTKIHAAEDLNGNGAEEVLLKAGRPTSPYGAAVLVSVADGQVIWRYDVEPMSYEWFMHTGHYLPDVESKQIVVIMHGYPPDKENGYIAFFDWSSGEATPKLKWRYDFSEYTCVPAVLQSDLDGDGIKDLAIETHSRMWFLDVFTGHVKHFVKWDVSPANIRSYGLNKFVDLNGDGREDFLCIGNFSHHHEVLLNCDGKMVKAWHHGWKEGVTTSKLATTWPEPPQADIDGDGKLELVVSMFNSERQNAWRTRVYDAVTGELKYRYPGMVAVRCIDIDGDGTAEILGTMTNDPTRSKFDGAQLLGVARGALKVLWEDREALALDRVPHRANRSKKIVSEDGLPVHQPARIEKDGQTFAMNKDQSGQWRCIPWQESVQKQAPDLPAIPAVLGAATPTLLAADLTGDGINELVLHNEQDVQVLHMAGDKLVPVAKYKSDAAPVLADLSGDGKNEIVLLQASDAKTPIVEAITPADKNKLLWRSVFPKIDRPGMPAPRKAYIRTIHLTGKPTTDLYVWAGAPLVRSVGLDGRTGTILWEKSEVPDKLLFGRYYGPSMNYASAWDFNKDGTEDLVFTNPDYYCVSDGLTGDFLLGPLFPPDIFKQPSQGLYTCPVILGQNDGPPTVCLVAGHYFQAAMSIKAEPYWYKTPPAGEARSAMEGFLQLEDGTWLMGFGRQNGKFACINVADGSLRWELDLQASTSDIVTGDVDGDGRQEFVFGTSHGQLYAVGDDGQAPRVVWKRELNAPVGAPVLADLNGDGRVEIACSTANGNLYVLGR